MKSYDMRLQNQKTQHISSLLGCVQSYNKRGTVIPCFDENNKIILSHGAVNFSDNKRFMHNCNTKPGNSGAPIILANNIKIIGIHTGFKEKENQNVGLYFQNILKYINNEKNKIEITVEVDEITKVKLIRYKKVSERRFYYVSKSCY